MSLQNTHYGQMVYSDYLPLRIHPTCKDTTASVLAIVTKEAKDLMEVYNKRRAEGFGDRSQKKNYGRELMC